MDYREAVREENRRLRRLRLIVDLTLAELYQEPDLSLLDALRAVERCRNAALNLFPGKERVFELVYRPRFERVLYRRWPYQLPDEVGDAFVLDGIER